MKERPEQFSDASCYWTAPVIVAALPNLPYRLNAQLGILFIKCPDLNSDLYSPLYDPLSLEVSDDCAVRCTPCLAYKSRG